MDHEYRLSAVLQIVQHSMNELFGSFPFWCIAEISKCKVHKGRVYLDLIEVDEGGSVVAQAKAMVWQEQLIKTYCRDRWLTSIEQLVGAEVCVQVVCNFHPQYGFSLSITEFSSAYAQGIEQQQRARAKQKLITDGIFEHNKKKEVGVPPLSLAIISWKQAAGLEDFTAILEQSPYRIEATLYTATVHGNTAKEEILAALSQIEQDIAQGKRYNLICLVRGWGGREGFVRSNDGELAEQVCRSSVPVISAIWHTADQSLIDEVARYAAKTPSDAAHYIVWYVAAYDQQATKWHAAIWQRLQLTAQHLRERSVMRMHAVNELLQQRVSQYMQNTVHRYETICMADPHALLAKGYALVQSPDKTYLSREQAKELREGDGIIVSIYDNNVYTTVDRIEKTSV